MSSTSGGRSFIQIVRIDPKIGGKCRRILSIEKLTHYRRRLDRRDPPRSSQIEVGDAPRPPRMTAPPNGSARVVESLATARLRTMCVSWASGRLRTVRLCPQGGKICENMKKTILAAATTNAAAGEHAKTQIWSPTEPKSAKKW